MTLMTEKEILKTGYIASKNVVEKYYLNIPQRKYNGVYYKDVSNERLTNIEKIAKEIYPKRLFVYNGKYGYGCTTDDNELISGSIIITYRWIDYFITYCDKGVSVSASIPVKRYISSNKSKENEVKSKNKTALFVTEGFPKDKLGIKNPSFYIDKKLVKYILTIKKEDYGFFHNLVASKSLELIERECNND